LNCTMPAMVVARAWRWLGCGLALPEQCPDRGPNTWVAPVDRFRLWLAGGSENGSARLANFEEILAVRRRGCMLRRAPWRFVMSSSSGDGSETCTPSRSTPSSALAVMSRPARSCSQQNRTKGSSHSERAPGWFGSRPARSHTPLQRGWLSVKRSLSLPQSRIASPPEEGFHTPRRRIHPTRPPLAFCVFPQVRTVTLLESYARAQTAWPSLVSPSGMVETPRLKAKYDSAKCERSEHEPSPCCRGLTP
jgi:hypothetical protein